MNKPTFVKNKEGLYRVRRGPVKAEDILDQAASILLDGIKEQEALTRPTDAARFLQLSLGSEKNEHFGVLFLDNRHQVLCFEKLFSGTIDSSMVYPRVVVQRALHHNAAAVIFAHNHPSGECEPSSSDKAITERLKDALALIDIRTLDHVIVSRTSWVSLAERGII